MRRTCLLVIVTHNQIGYIKGCLESVFATTQYPYRVLVIDNASTDGTGEYLRGLQREGRIDVIFNDVGRYWVGGINQGVEAVMAQGYDYACLMNDDLITYPGWLERLVAVAESDERIGIVNPSWELPRRRPGDVNAWVRRNIEPRGTAWIEQDWVRGFCFLVKRRVFEAIGGLDEAFAPGYYDDTDFSVRAVRKGFLTVRAEGAFVDHIENGTFTSVERRKLLEDKRAVFEARWGRKLNLFVALTPCGVAGDSRIRDLLLATLRDQNRVTGIQTASGLLPRHTECRATTVSGVLLYPAVLAALADNRRHSRKKHFDLVLASSAVAGFIRSIPGLGKKYRVVDIGDETACRQTLAVLKGPAELAIAEVT